MYGNNQIPHHFPGTNPVDVWADAKHVRHSSELKRELGMEDDDDDWGCSVGLIVVVSLVCLAILIALGLGFVFFLSGSKVETYQDEEIDISWSKKGLNKRRARKDRPVNKRRADMDQASAESCEHVHGRTADKQSMKAAKRKQEKEIEERITGTTELKKDSQDRQYQVVNKKRGWYNPKRWVGKKHYAQPVVDSRDPNAAFEKRGWYNPARWVGSKYRKKKSQAQIEAAESAKEAKRLESEKAKKAAEEFEKAADEILKAAKAAKKQAKLDKKQAKTAKREPRSPQPPPDSRRRLRARLVRAESELN